MQTCRHENMQAKTEKPHLIWVGQVGGHTGLARVSDALLSRLQAHWRITVVSLNHPEGYQCPYAERMLNGIFAHDELGKLVTRKLCETDPPDVLVPFFDPGPVAEFLPFMPTHIPIIAYMPVDAENVMHGDWLNLLAHGIFLTQFGLNEARKGGYTGEASVIGHGVDLELYQPKDRYAARARLETKPKLEHPQDAFLFGAVNRNQIRKRFDLTLYAFKTFLDQTHATDAYLYCHCQERAYGWDLPDLARHWGISNRILFPSAPLGGLGVPEELMPWVYSALDVQVSTTQGEGFGLTHLEGMACGVPQIVPNFSALAEWPGEAVYHVPVVAPAVTCGSTNLVEWCVDYRAMAEAMRLFYRVPWLREYYAVHGRALAEQPQFRWDALAEQFHNVLEGVASHAMQHV